MDRKKAMLMRMVLIGVSFRFPTEKNMRFPVFCSRLYNKFSSFYTFLSFSSFPWLWKLIFHFSQVLCNFWAHLCICTVTVTVGSYASHSVCLSVWMWLDQKSESMKTWHMVENPKISPWRGFLGMWDRQVGSHQRQASRVSPTTTAEVWVSLWQQVPWRQICALCRKVWKIARHFWFVEVVFCRDNFSSFLYESDLNLRYIYLLLKGKSAMKMPKAKSKSAPQPMEEESVSKIYDFLKLILSLTPNHTEHLLGVFRGVCRILKCDSGAVLICHQDEPLYVLSQLGSTKFLTTLQTNDRKPILCMWNVPI